MYDHSSEEIFLPPDAGFLKSPVAQTSTWSSLWRWTGAGRGDPEEALSLAATFRAALAHNLETSNILTHHAVFVQQVLKVQRLGLLREGAPRDDQQSLSSTLVQPSTSTEGHGSSSSTQPMQDGAKEPRAWAKHFGTKTDEEVFRIVAALQDLAYFWTFEAQLKHADGVVGEMDQLNPKPDDVLNWHVHA